MKRRTGLAALRLYNIGEMINNKDSAYASYTIQRHIPLPSCHLSVIQPRSRRTESP